MSQKTNMPEFIRSECPNCHTQYKVSLAQLSDGKNKARCGTCDTPFLITENLAHAPIPKTAIHKGGGTKADKSPQQPVVTETSNSNASQIEASSSTKQTVAPAAVIDDDIPDDLLIYDEMLGGKEDELEAISDDAFDADFGDDWLFTNDLDSASHLGKTSVFDTLGNDNEAPSDDSWIESLLAEEGLDDAYIEDRIEDRFVKNSSAVPLDNLESFTEPETNSNLSSLLDDLGVQTSAPEVPEKTASIKRTNARLQKRNSQSVSTAPNFSSPSSSILTLFFWLLGCIALVLLLFAQYILFNLDSLIKNPTQQTRLQEFCAMVNCALPDADIAKLVITNQRRLPSKTAANATDIMAVIGNQSTHAQLFPNIKVRLYSDNQLIGEFIAEPNDYLETPQRLMGSSQVTLFMLTVDIDPNTITKVDITPFY